MEVYYHRSATPLVSAEDVPIIPEEFRDVLTHGALADAYPTMAADESRGQMYETKFQQGLAILATQNRERTGQKPAIAPKDQYRGHFKSRRGVSTGTVDLGSWFDRIGRWGP
jgi:hypothetical protein